MEVLQNDDGRGKLLPMRNGFLICPYCRRNKKLMRIPPKSEGRGLVAWCKDCRREVKFDIFAGQSFESRSQ